MLVALLKIVDTQANAVITQHMKHTQQKSHTVSEKRIPHHCVRRPSGKAVALTTFAFASTVVKLECIRTEALNRRADEQVSRETMLRNAQKLLERNHSRHTRSRSHDMQLLIKQLLQVIRRNNQPQQSSTCWRGRCQYATRAGAFGDHGVDRVQAVRVLERTDSLLGCMSRVYICAHGLSTSKDGRCMQLRNLCTVIMMLPLPLRRSPGWPQPYQNK